MFMSRLYVFFFFLWASFALMALDPDKKVTQYDVQVWDIKTGLPGNTVFAIQQTHDGYLWIGTKEGLVRFDGTDFELFTQEKIPQLESNDIRALYVDRDNTLWIGTDLGGLTRFKNGKFTTYPTTEHKGLNKIRAINRDKWGNLWVGSLTGGLTCLNNGKFTGYTTDMTENGLPHSQVRSIHKDGNGDLWVTTIAGIVKLLEQGISQVYASNKDLPYNKTDCLYKEDTKELWIGTSENLFCLENNTFTPYGANAGIPHHIITFLYVDMMKNLWIGTDGGGLARMTNGVLSTLSVENGLADGAVHTIYEDREGSLWVGTLDGGLHQLRDSKFTAYTTTEGLAHDYIQCIYESRDGNLWIGTQGGLNVLNLDNREVATVLTVKRGLLHNSVTSLFEDPSGYLWIGTWGGLHRFKDGKLETFTKQNGLINNQVKCINGDHRGNIWVGTESGLNRFDNSKNTLTVFTKEDALSGNSIEFIFADSRGDIWIGSDAGLNRLIAGAIAAYRPADEKRDHFFRCAYEDNEGVLWFGTKHGLIQFTQKDKETSSYTYTLQKGLIENNIYAILEDENGYLWLGGENGISRVSKEELADVSNGVIDRVHPESYNEKDGMKSRWCTGAGYKTRDNRLWFPTSIGVATIDPNQIKKNNVLPSVIIKKLMVDGEPVDIHAAARGTNRLELAPGKKRLEFYYTVASFINPDRIKFKLKFELEGYDSDWVEMGTTRSTTYTGLSPGSYTFNVTAAYPGGDWNPEIASLSFNLKPYFWQATWFHILSAFIVLLSTYLLYRFRVRQLKTREKELGSQVELRTRDLQERNIELENARQNIQQSKELIEAKNLQLESQTVQLTEQSEKLKEMDKVKSRFFANISHEFRTPLTLIMGPMEQMLADSHDNEQKKKLNLMLRNSQRLLGLINQLLELSKFESGKVKLQAGRQNIVPFLKGIVASFEILADQREVDLRFQVEEEDIPLYFDAAKIEDVMSNLLINAIKFTPPGGEIKVTLTKSFYGGSRGAVFSKSAPLAAGG